MRAMGIMGGQPTRPMPMLRFASIEPSSNTPEQMAIRVGRVRSVFDQMEAARPAPRNHTFIGFQSIGAHGFLNVFRIHPRLLTLELKTEELGESLVAHVAGDGTFALPPQMYAFAPTPTPADEETARQDLIAALDSAVTNHNKGRRGLISPYYADADMLTRLRTHGHLQLPR